MWKTNKKTACPGGKTGGHRRKMAQRQPGAALRLLQAPSGAHRRNRPSAVGNARRRREPKKAPSRFGRLGVSEEGQRRRPHPVDDTGSRRWRSAPIFTRALRRPLGKLAKRKRNAVCFLQAGAVPRRKNRAPQPGLGIQILPAKRQSLCHRIRRAA